MKKVLTLFCCILAQLCLGEEKAGYDMHFLATLRQAGVLDAAEKLGLDAGQVFVPLATKANYPYRRYRWWVGQDEQGKPIIHALPPEEEVGWTPWERWSLEAGKPVHRSWVLYPLPAMPTNGIPRWYVLPPEERLRPRFLDAADSLETQLRRARVDVAAQVLGLDFKATFIEPLSSSERLVYAQFRWVVIPHLLGADHPVIYALPPPHLSGCWPWESWYTDGVIPRIHHVHFTSPTPRTTGQWRETFGAQQRPPEIMGSDWYWYDDPSMKPALAGRLPLDCGTGDSPKTNSPSTLKGKP